MNKYCLVAVNTPFNNSMLTYGYDEDQEPCRGEIWEVPLGKRKVMGCIVETPYLDETLSGEEIKKIYQKIEGGIFLDKDYLDFLSWVAGYYHYPLGMLIYDVLPKILKRPRELTSYIGDELQRIILNKRQEDVYQLIKGGLDKFSTNLVFGVTGSGKTTVYTKLIEEVVDNGKSALFILPEINLTNQFIDFLKSHLGCNIYCYNSALSNSDRYGLWKLLENDSSPKVILAVRSGIFLPVKKLGLIIVDEEHDHSFKQEDRCCYNARDLAVKLAQIKNIPVVLGSATPMLETLHKFKERNAVYEMAERYGDQQLPEIEIVSELDKSSPSDYWPFVDRSIELIRESLAKNEQVIVLLNRLGYSNYLQCRSCSHQFFCKNCSIPLRYFKGKKILSCQTCSFEMNPPEECPECGNMALLNIGYGTEKIKEVLQELLPGKRIERFDRDEIHTFTKINSRLDEFHAGEIDILVGTQMLSKGHNFKRVNTVLVLGVDSMLNFPDFRSTERAFQLLLQVAGRAGRFSGKGRVIVQTKSPGNRIFELVENHDYKSFYDYEMKMRELCNFPPFNRLAMVYLVSRFLDRVTEDAKSCGNFLRSIAEKFSKVEILGPRPAMIEKRANKYTFCLMISSKNINELHNLISTFQQNLKLSTGTTIKVDIDPYHIS